MEKVSVIIPTYNRFLFLQNAIDSIKSQTYTNLEIIVINDCSTQQEYYHHDWEGVTIIHLKQNTKSMFGYACTGFVRNEGIRIATGKYVAFCDDDDIWFPKKLEIQLKAMRDAGCQMSSTDGLIGHGEYSSLKNYKKYNAEHFWNTLQNIYRNKGSALLENGFPDIWTLPFLKVHNCMITSSVLMEKSVLDKIDCMKTVRNGGEDYDCWLRALEHTNSVYVRDICFFYDLDHGYGQNY